MRWFRAPTSPTPTTPGIRAFREANIVWVEAHGPFDINSIEQFSRAITEVYAGVPANQAIVNITVFSGSMLAAPEVWFALDAHLQQINGSGLNLVATAWVAAADLQERAAVIAHAEHNFRLAGRLFKVFEHREPAVGWAQRLLAAH